MWSWDGLVLLMEGRRHGRPDGITDVLWLKVDPCPTRVLPYLVIVAKQRKQCQQTGIPICHVVVLSVIAHGILVNKQTQKLF